MLTTTLPAWVERVGGQRVSGRGGSMRWVGGKLRLIPERAAVVKKIFHLAANGYGMASIVKWLTDNNVPTFGEWEWYTDEDGKEHRRAKTGQRYGSGVWVRAYVAKILKDRRAVGEHQPRGKGRKPMGDPIPGYFPVVVTEEEFLAARAGAAERKRRRGRLGKHINLFTSLLMHARDRESCFYTATRWGQRVIANTAGAEGRMPFYSFPSETFDGAILSHLREIDPHDILNGDHGPDPSLVLAGQVEALENAIAVIAAELDEHGESPTLYRRLRAKEAEYKELAERLADARQKAANPLSEVWGEAQTLAGALAAAPDPEDARLRLRSALRKIVSAVWVLIVPRGRDRLCAVQIWFAEEKRHRDYLILHRPPKANAAARHPGGWWARSLSAVAKVGDLDLRERDHTARLEAVLQTLDLSAVTKG